MKNQRRIKTLEKSAGVRNVMSWREFIEIDDLADFTPEELEAWERFLQEREAEADPDPGPTDEP